MRVLAIALAVFSMVAGSAPSEQGNFDCVVLGVYEIDDEGILSESVFQPQMKGAQFTVSLASGRIVGRVLPTFGAQSVEVLYPGDSANSFRALARFDAPGAGPSAQVIDVQSWRQDAMKPFVAYSMGGAGIVSGLCR